MTGQTTGQREVTRRRCQLELTGRRGRRRAWQIGRFELTCSLALTVMVAVLMLYFYMFNFCLSAVHRTFYAVFRNVCFFRTIVEVSIKYSLQCFDAVGWAAGRASGL